MKVLYIIKRDIDSTVDKIIETQRLNNEVNIVNLYENSADTMLDLIEKHDKLFVW